MDGLDQQRLMTKVARLYHVLGLRQAEVAERLRLSQSRVSRLLQQAEDAGIVRTVVVAPAGLHAEVEERLEQRYGLREVHVVDTVAADEDELVRDLGHALATVLAGVPLRAATLGFTSWSRTLRAAVDVLQPGAGSAEVVVETLGDLGPPALQHEAAHSTERLAALTGAQPLYLRAPGVMPSPAVRSALLAQDAHTRRALALLGRLDVALVGLGPARVPAHLAEGDGFFTAEQLATARALGAVGEVGLRFLDADGALVPTPLDDLVIGATAEQLRRAPHRCGVAGGPGKREAVRAALAGGWLDVLVTDTGTARHLLDAPA